MRALVYRATGVTITLGAWRASSPSPENPTPLRSHRMKLSGDKLAAKVSEKN